MSDLTGEFLKLVEKKEFNADMLVPLLVWSSGYESNIEIAQHINKNFYNVSKVLNSRTLLYNNKLRHFIKYPKGLKDDDKLDFFYNDVCSFFGWTRNEMDKNIGVLNIPLLKTEIAEKFGYDKGERKMLGLEELECQKTHRKKKQKGS